MITLTPGRVLTPGDLYLMTRDASGQVLTPFSVTYAIFQVANGALSLLSAPAAVPSSPQPGYYYVNTTLPTIWPEGTYRLVWTLHQASGDTATTITEDFAIQGVKPAYNLQAPSVLLATTMTTKPQYADTIMSVRALLSDTNPDRNYHFRPPTAAKAVANYSARVGFIWEDPIILVLLKVALARINSANPMNFYNFTLDNIATPQGEAFRECAALGAAALCLSSEGARWTADEFGYSLNGVSLDLQKGQNYLALAQVYQTAFETWLTPLTANRPRSCGLRQYKWLR